MDRRHMYLTGGGQALDMPSLIDERDLKRALSQVERFARNLEHGKVEMTVHQGRFAVKAYNQVEQDQT